MTIRKIFISSVAALLGGNMFISAQEPDNKRGQQDLNREMTLEREYAPIIQDAAKVNTLPVVREMTIPKTKIEYANFTMPIQTEKEMYVLPASTLMTDVPHSKRNGYLHFGGGMLMNFSGDAGYHIVNTEQERLSLHFSHRSTNGKVEFKDESIEKRKAKLNDNIGGLDFLHHFDGATLSLGGSFGYSTFNYYGQPIFTHYPCLGGYTIETLSEDYGFPFSMPDFDTNQADRNINVYAGVKSNRPTFLGYHFGVDYTNFNQKYSLSKDLKGMTESNIGINFGINSPEKDGQTFGIDAKLNILTYSELGLSSYFVNYTTDSGAFDTRYEATLTPYYRIARDTWSLLLGANLMLVSQSGETDVFASPNIALDVPFSTTSKFYIHAKGGIESNTMSQVSQYNRYINPAFAPDASKTWADARIGISSSVAAGLWFDIFAGFKYTEADLFFNPSAYPWGAACFNNVSMAYQPTSARFQVGASLKYDFQKVFDFYINGIFSNYSFKQVDSWKNACYGVRYLDDDDIKPFGRPTLQMNAGFNVRPIKPLTINVDYRMLSGAYTHIPAISVNEKMGSIHDLRLRSSWKFNDVFSIYLQVNNLLFRTQEVYYGYPLQPFTAMAGFNINF